VFLEEDKGGKGDSRRQRPFGSPKDVGVGAFIHIHSHPPTRNTRQSLTHPHEVVEVGAGEQAVHVVDDVAAVHDLPKYVL
jgi:hypothetical protein